MKKLIGLTFMVALTMESSLRAEHIECISEGNNRYMTCRNTCKNFGGMKLVMPGGTKAFGTGDTAYDKCIQSGVKMALCICKQ